MRSKPNVILIVMDTVRADHLSTYGYARKTSPNIDKIAKEGVMFENAFSAAPWSPPSHASIFTGKYPSHHGTLGKNVFLNKDSIVLAEILSLNGYKTIGINSCEMIGSKSGLNRGFQEYIETYEMPDYIIPLARIIPNLKPIVDMFRCIKGKMIYGQDKYTCETNEIVKRWIKRNFDGNKNPFFLFVNYFNCHPTYNPPRYFKKKFVEDFDRSRLYLKELLYNFFGKTTERIANSNLNIRKLHYIAKIYGAYSFMAKELQVSKEEWEVIKAWYDGEISYLDYRIGELVDFLDKENIYDNTLLIITADHGENFGDHNLAGHFFCVYDSLLHVPLVLRYPDLIQKGKRMSNLASTVDIFPTVLDVLGVTNGPKDIQGASLYPFEDREIHNFVCAELGKSITSIDEIRSVPQSFKLKKLDRGLKCIRTKEYKYILSSEGKEELYDVKNDPSEEINISAAYPNKTKYLKKQLEKALDISYYGPEEYLAKERAEILDRLRRLGYFG